MSCGCTDPAAGGGGGCCSLADTLAVGNSAGGVTITGLGGPTNPADAARLQDVGAALGYGGKLIIDAGPYAAGDYLTFSDGGQALDLTIIAKPGGGSIIVPPNLVAAGIGMGLWNWGAVLPFVTQFVDAPQVKGFGMYWVQQDGTFVAVVDGLNQTNSAVDPESDNTIRLNNFVSWRPNVFAACGIAIQASYDVLLTGQRTVYGYRVGG